MPLFIRHLPKDDTKKLNFRGVVMVAAVSFCFVSSLQPLQATASSPDAPAGISAPEPFEAEEPTRGSVVNIIVIGGTGDLSTRYLWQGFFNLINGELLIWRNYIDCSSHHMSFSYNELKAIDFMKRIFYCLTSDNELCSQI